jgi:heptosyltransferase II
MNSLIIAPNWVGDAVMAQPLLARLREADPQARIDVLAPEPIGAVFRAMTEVDEVLGAPQRHGKLQLAERWRTAQRLRARGYARCYVLPNSAKSALIAWLAAIPRRIGHQGEARYLLLNERHRPAADRPPAHAHAKARAPMVEFYAHLAGAPRDPWPQDVPDPRLCVQPSMHAQARARLGLAPDPALIVLCPGAEYGPAKRWPAGHFAQLTALVAQARPDTIIAILGSEKDRELAQEIVAQAGPRVHNLCGRTTLDEAIALISQADGVVSNDSGLMHVAAALRRPQVALFGSSDPRHTPARSPRATMLWLELECSPCFRRECPLGHLACLNRITAQQVFEALCHQLQSSKTATTPP